MKVKNLRFWPSLIALASLIFCSVQPPHLHGHPNPILRANRVTIPGSYIFRYRVLADSGDNEESTVQTIRFWASRPEPEPLPLRVVVTLAGYRTTKNLLDTRPFYCPLKRRIFAHRADKEDEPA